MESITNRKTFFLGLGSVLCYLFLGYFINRNQFITLLFTTAILFVCYFYFIKYKNSNTSNLLLIGIFFRIILIGTSPSLSQDFYRFIWDGRLLLLGISPYEYVPNSIINVIQIPQAKLLFDGMGNLSASHFSNYPPVNQLLFALAAVFSAKSILGSIIILRIEIIVADIVIYFIGKRILQLLSMNQNTIYFYFLNPLVIIELTGNLHFEAVMMCFFLLGIYYLLRNKLLLSVVFISLSISTKLLPLLLIPVLFQYVGWKKSVPFYGAIVILNLMLFLPFASSNLLQNYTNTISLWFTNFEFNASFYYLIRAVGFYFKGYNIIGTVGRITPILLLLFVAWITFFIKNKTPTALFSSFLLVLTVYFFQSTTVHPWYIINLVILACFTKFRFAMVWSGTVFLSYFAYSNTSFKENNMILFLEYALVLAFIIYEINYQKQHKQIV